MARKQRSKPELPPPVPETPEEAADRIKRYRQNSQCEQIALNILSSFLETAAANAKTYWEAAQKRPQDLRFQKQQQQEALAVARVLATLRASKEEKKPERVYERIDEANRQAMLKAVGKELAGNFTAQEIQTMLKGMERRNGDGHLYAAPEKPNVEQEQDAWEVP